MPVTIDYSTYTINVPQSYLTQTGPSTYTLDTNEFRITLRDLEDDEAGMPHPKTHNHNTKVTLSGIEYARVIEILSPYSITFEDTGTPYRVFLTGSNNNILDVANLNNVSIAPSNSAGLVQMREIQFAAFSGPLGHGVYYDETNGYAGTLYPKGSSLEASNDPHDAKTIAEGNGFRVWYIINDFTVPEYEHDNVTPWELIGYTIMGSGKSTTVIDVPVLPTIERNTYMNAHVTGTLDGDNVLHDCLLTNLTYIKGYIESCVLSPGTITLGGSDTAHFLNCASGVPGVGTPTIDMGGSGQPLAMRDYDGGVKLINKTGPESVSIDLQSGQVRIDLTTVTNGTIVVRGDGKCVNDADDTPLPTGYYGSLYILNEANNPTAIANAVLDETA